MDATTQPSTSVKVVKAVLSILIVLVIAYFYGGELKKNSVDLSTLAQELNIFLVMLALFLSLLSYLSDFFIWKSILGIHQGPQKITSPELAAMLYASGLFRYLPGRIWTYAAQFAWLNKYGITKSRFIYINSVCMIELIITSLYFGLMYLAMYENGPSAPVIILLSAVLLLANLLYNCYNSQMISRIFLIAGKIANRDIQPISIPVAVMFRIQAVFTVGWLLTGLSVYLLSMGVGLPIFPADMVPVLASLSLSWVAGYLAITPAGLGVREGMMLVMLKPAVAMQTALLLPILFRLMILLSEALLGVMALFLGIKCNVFSFGKSKVN